MRSALPERAVPGPFVRIEHTDNAAVSSSSRCSRSIQVPNTASHARIRDPRSEIHNGPAAVHHPQRMTSAYAPPPHPGLWPSFLRSFGLVKGSGILFGSSAEPGSCRAASYVHVTCSGLLMAVSGALFAPGREISS